MTSTLASPRSHRFVVVGYHRITIILVHRKQIVGWQGQVIEIGNYWPRRGQHHLAILSVCQALNSAEIRRRFFQFLQQLPNRMFIVGKHPDNREVELRIIGHNLLRHRGVHQTAADGDGLRSDFFDFLHRRMKAVERRGAARRRDHGAKEHRIRPLPLHLVDHLVVVQPQRAAVEDRHLRGFFLADKCRDLGVQRVDGQMTVAPRRPIAHRWRNKEEFHAISWYRRD